MCGKWTISLLEGSLEGVRKAGISVVEKYLAAAAVFIGPYGNSR